MLNLKCCTVPIIFSQHKLLWVIIRIQEADCRVAAWLVVFTWSEITVSAAPTQPPLPERGSFQSKAHLPVRGAGGLIEQEIGSGTVSMATLCVCMCVCLCVSGLKWLQPEGLHLSPLSRPWRVLTLQRRPWTGNRTDAFRGSTGPETSLSLANTEIFQWSRSATHYGMLWWMHSLWRDLILALGESPGDHQSCYKSLCQSLDQSITWRPVHSKLQIEKLRWYQRKWVLSLWS